MKTNTTQVILPLAVALLVVAGSTASQAAPTLRSLQMGKQMPDPALKGGMASYPITVTKAGSGSLEIYLTSTGLPAGATVSFVPPKVTFTDGGPSTKNATMVVRVAATTESGTYPFTLKAQHGNSQSTLNQPNLLVVGSDGAIVQQPLLDVPVRQPDGNIGLSGIGTALQPVLIQATTNLASATAWETIAVQTLNERGLFSLVDQDSTNYPARFYRAAQ